MKNAYKFIGMLLAIFVLPGVAAACMCVLPPTVDKEFDRHVVVGVFKVVSVKYNADPPKEGELIPNYSRVIKFSVEKVFKGGVKEGDKFSFTQRGYPGCERSFFPEEDEGKKFLFYILSDPATDKNWKVSGCSRSDQIGKAAADMLWFEKMQKLRGKTRLSGTVKQYFETSDKTGRTEMLASSPVVITGNGKTIELNTDQNGVYEVYDLAPGKYCITPVRIDGFSASETGYEEVEISAGAHSEKNFTFQINKAIR